MTDKEVMQMALDALEDLDGIDTETECVTIHVEDVIEALRAALAQPEEAIPLLEYKRLQKLVTYQGIRLMEYESQPIPEREWVSLTAEELAEISEKCGLMDAAWEDVMHEVEAKIKKRNT